MGETYHYHQASSRLGIRRSGLGEIVEVQGGHIIRSTGRKDRHSKVCTAKGTRDRRVRLSAHTAIQFYDVQDRLGYDRPSKAVDWLMKKAKKAIDELAELPAWKPSNGSTEDMDFGLEEIRKQSEDNHQDSVHNQHQQLRIVDEGDGGNAISFFPSGLHSDSLADTIKSFFPMGSLPEGNTSDMQFQSFPLPDLLSRINGQSQDLRHTLQSFQDPVLLHHQNPPSHTDQELVQAHAQAACFAGTTPLQLGFDGSGWPHSYRIQQPNELYQFQKLPSFNIHTNTDSTNGGAGQGYSFNSTPLTSSLQPFFGQNQICSQRGPLQSSNSPPVRARIDSSLIAIPTTEHCQHQQLHQAMLLNYQSSLSGIGYASGVSSFSGCFHIPARIQGDEEEHDGMSDQPSSVSSDSHH